MKREVISLFGGPFSEWTWHLRKPFLKIPVDFVGELCTTQEWDDKEILHKFNEHDIRNGYHLYRFIVPTQRYEYSHSVVNKPVELPA